MKLYRYADSLAVTKGCPTIADGRIFLLNVNGRWKPGDLDLSDANLDGFSGKDLERVHIVTAEMPHKCSKCGDPLMHNIIGHDYQWMWGGFYCAQHPQDLWIDVYPKHYGGSTEWDNDNAWVIPEPERDPITGDVLLMGGAVRIIGSVPRGEILAQRFAVASPDFWLTPKGLKYTKRGWLRKLLRRFP